MRFTGFKWWSIGLILQLALASSAADDTPSPDISKPPARGEFLILPLHIHVLSAKDRPEIDCKLSDSDIDRIIGKVNRVWSMAGIAFRVEAVYREPAGNLDLFDKQKDLLQSGALGVYRTLAPADTRDLPGLHVYYIHELPVNGVYLGGNICFIKETASLRKVEGGIDEPIPRVSSHELGHALGLPHRQAVFNLMASGTTGTILNEAEMTRTRATAKKIAGVMTVEECEAAKDKAEKAGDDKLSKRLHTVLGELPAP